MPPSRAATAALLALVASALAWTVPWETAVEAALSRLASAGQDDGGGRAFDCVLVLGTSVDPHTSLPTPGLGDRIDAAARLLADGSSRAVLLTGGRDQPHLDSEAAVMRRALLSALARIGGAGTHPPLHVELEERLRPTSPPPSHHRSLGSQRVTREVENKAVPSWASQMLTRLG